MLGRMIFALQLVGEIGRKEIFLGHIQCPIQALFAPFLGEQGNVFLVAGTSDMVRFQNVLNEFLIVSLAGGIVHVQASDRVLGKIIGFIDKGFGSNRSLSASDTVPGNGSFVPDVFDSGAAELSCLFFEG